MATYQPLNGERLEQVAWKFYGSGASEYVQAILYANPQLTYADAQALRSEITLTLPDTIPSDYSLSTPPATPELRTLFDILAGTARREAAAAEYHGYRAIGTEHHTTGDYAPADYDSDDYNTV